MHDQSRDARVTEGVLHARDLLMASAALPLQALLLRPNGMSGWHVLYTPDGLAAGAVDFTCKLFVPVLLQEAAAPQSHEAGWRGRVLDSGEMERQVEVQLLLEEVLIDGMEEVEYALMGTGDGPRSLQLEYSLCGLVRACFQHCY